jgi:transcriptional regulator with XRE-family HTH domain
MFPEKLDIPRMVRTEREKRFMTYADVAKGVGVSASYIYRLEKGMRKKPSFDVLARIIEFFGLTDRDLRQYIDGDISEPPILGIQQELLDFAKEMDTNSMAEVSKLLDMVREYQNSVRKVSSLQ